MSQRGKVKGIREHVAEELHPVHKAVRQGFAREAVSRLRPRGWQKLSQ